MSDQVSLSPIATGNTSPRFGRVLGSIFIASCLWQILQLARSCARNVDSSGPWLGLAAALPFLALTAVGAMRLLRGETAGCWLIMAAGIVSLFYWPVPSVPYLNRWLQLRAPFSVPRLLAISWLQGFNALVVLLTLLDYYWFKRASEPFQLSSVRWPRAVLVLLGVLIVLGGKRALTQRFDEASAAMLEQGNTAFELGKQQEALNIWRRVIDHYPRTRSWGMALFNTSLVYRERDRWADAIPLLEELLASELNDTDPTPYLMTPYQNYHHQACLGLMDCYDRQKDYTAALRYAKLARDRHPYESWCGTCSLESQRLLSRKILRLKIRIGGPQAPSRAVLQAMAEGGKVLCFAFAPDDQLVMSGTNSGEIRSWEPDGGAIARSIVLEGLPDLNALAFAPDGQNVAGWGCDGSVVIWAVADRRQRLEVSQHAGKGSSLAFSPDGKTLAGAGDGIVVLWDATTGQRRARLEDSAGTHEALVFSPDGRSLACGIWNDVRDNPIKLWNLETGKLRATLHRDSSAIYALAFSPDGSILACANQRGGPVERWDIKAAQQLPPLLGHTHNTIAVAFSPDGKTLASADMDGMIKLWDSATGQERFSLKPKSRVDRLAFTADGRTVASLTAWEQAVQLWDVQTGLQRTLQEP